MIRLLLLLVIVPLSGLALFYQWQEPRWRHFAGWLSPAMNIHWERLFRERSNHAAKNVLAEWVALDPQRAGKLFSFVVAVLFVLIAVLV